MERKEIASQIYLKEGSTITVRVLDGLLIDDVVVLSMKAEGYRVMTGRDVFPVMTRKLRDYLIRTGILLE